MSGESTGVEKKQFLPAGLLAEARGVPPSLFLLKQYSVAPHLIAAHAILLLASVARLAQERGSLTRGLVV